MSHTEDHRLQNLMWKQMIKLARLTFLSNNKVCVKKSIVGENGKQVRAGTKSKTLFVFLKTRLEPLKIEFRISLTRTRNEGGRKTDHEVATFLDGSEDSLRNGERKMILKTLL